MFPRFTPKFTKKFRQGQLPLDDARVWQQLQKWYASALGKQLFEDEKQILETSLPDLFGYFLLQCGCPEIKAEKLPGNWLKSSRVSCRICLDQLAHQTLDCQASPAQLPMKADSLDIVVLPHILEFATNPHQVLREVERVLIAEGHVVILGFNPRSIWNLFRLFLFWKNQAPWNGHFLTASRVMDWLALLGFDVVQRQGYFYRPPFQRVKLMKKMGFLEKMGRRLWPNFGAGYVIVARKRVETLTPIRPSWRSKRQVITSGLETINRNKM